MKVRQCSVLCSDPEMLPDINDAMYCAGLAGLPSYRCKYWYPVGDNWRADFVDIASPENRRMFDRGDVTCISLEPLEPQS